MPGPFLAGAALPAAGGTAAMGAGAIASSGAAASAAGAGAVAGGGTLMGSTLAGGTSAMSGISTAAAPQFSWQSGASANYASAAPSAGSNPWVSQGMGGGGGGAPSPSGGTPGGSMLAEPISGMIGTAIQGDPQANPLNTALMMAREKSILPALVASGGVPSTLELGPDEMNKYKDFRKLQGQLFANQERMAGIGFATSALGAQPRPQTPFPGVRI